MWSKISRIDFAMRDLDRTEFAKVIYIIDADPKAGIGPDGSSKLTLN